VSDYSKENWEFNNFIERSELLDIPMIGRKFTWYKSDGSVKSRIDRVMISKDWLKIWPNSKHFVYSRSVSSHCIAPSSLKMSALIEDQNHLEAWTFGRRTIDSTKSCVTNGLIMMWLEEGCSF